MNVMYSVEDFFVRIRQDAGKLKVTVWNSVGDKVVSDYVSAASLDKVWNNISKASSEAVVESIKERMK
ncbi:MAG: hypothetical protein GX208_01225 [Firmicutes bacterium]|nr:hypothetical protein [Bacillota bacterium]